MSNSPKHSTCHRTFLGNRGLRLHYYRFRSFGRSWIESLRPVVQPRATPRPRLDLSAADPLSIDAVWLADLKVWLPGSWAHIEISSKAVKSDNAAVAQHPWNQRVLLACPAGNIATIRGIEEALCLKRWYLHCVFGAAIWPSMAPPCGAICP